MRFYYTTPKSTMDPTNNGFQEEPPFPGLFSDAVLVFEVYEFRTRIFRPQVALKGKRLILDMSFFVRLGAGCH